MDFLVFSKQQAWSDSDQQPVTTDKQAPETLDFFDELFAALSTGEVTTNSVAAQTQSVAGSGTAVGDRPLQNIPVGNGYLESDLSIPILFGISPVPVNNTVADPTPQKKPATITTKHISWILIVIIVLVVIIFLRGLFLKDGSAN